MTGKQAPVVIDWRDLLLILTLWLVLYLSFDLLIEWTAAKWNGLLQVRSSRTDFGSLLAIVLSV